MTPELERKHLRELSKVSGQSLDRINAVANAQLALVLRDLALKGQAVTILGELKLVKGKVVLTDPNTQLDRYRDESGMASKLHEELRDDE